MDKLLPCPFCGCRADGVDVWSTEGFHPKRVGYKIRCCKCSAEKSGKDWNRLVKSWNKRVTHG